MLDQILGRFSPDIGIDLGTANTLVYVKNRGIVLSEPSVVALEKSSRRVLAVGHEAKAMLGRTPGQIRAVRPLSDGVIADYSVTETLLRHFIRKASAKHPWFRPRPRCVIAVPSGITEVEHKAVSESAHAAGAREVYLVPEPMCAAIGAGLPVESPNGNMVVDIGGGTTEIAIISLAGLVSSQSVRLAGDEMNTAIVNHIKRTYNMMIGERTAEAIKIEIGSATVLPQILTMEVKGFDLIAGLPKTLNITSEEVREALSEPVNAVIEAVRLTLENCPPEISADLVDNGIWLAGGGALLKGLDALLQEETALPIHVAEDPLSAVARGTGRILENLKFTRQFSLGAHRTGVSQNIPSAVSAKEYSYS